MRKRREEEEDEAAAEAESKRDNSMNVLQNGRSAC